MRVDALAVRLRPRTATEAADLGIRLCQEAARSVYACYAVVAVPLVLLSLTAFEFAPWLPTVLIWWAKPWLDRSILFVLSRAAFGQETTLGDLWRARRSVWWHQLVPTLTIGRLSLWRSVTQPVYQLEQVSFWRASSRVRQIRRRTMSHGLMATHAFYVAETAVTLSLLSLAFWLAPAGAMPEFATVFGGELDGAAAIVPTLAYAIAVLFVEPFYVAAGFAMYLNRRAELEGWDIEQELRRAFGR